MKQREELLYSGSKTCVSQIRDADIGNVISLDNIAILHILSKTSSESILNMLIKQIDIRDT